MSEISAGKKTRGRHKNSCTCERCIARRIRRENEGSIGLAAQTQAGVSFGTAKPASPSVSKGAPASLGQPRTEVTKTELENKMDYFQYTMDEEASALWEHDETLSPLHIPRPLRSKYPELTWHFLSRAKLDAKGVGYNAWQIFKDKNHPNGLTRGPDLIAGVMPNHLAESYRRKVSERSTEAVRNIQRGAVAKMEQALGQLGDPQAGILGSGDSVAGREVRNASNVVRRARVGIGGNGLSREQVHEQIMKNIEDRNKGKKVYVDMGR